MVFAKYGVKIYYLGNQKVYLKIKFKSSRNEKMIKTKCAHLIWIKIKKLLIISNLVSLSIVKASFSNCTTTVLTYVAKNAK